MYASKLTPPSLSNLTMKLMTEAPAGDARLGGEVEPHEVAVGFHVDPQLAWQEGLVALGSFGVAADGVGMPAEWPALVARHEAQAAQPMALVAYPQQVRDVGTLLQTVDLSSLMPAAKQSDAPAKWNIWAEKQLAKQDPVWNLLVAATYRMIGDLDRANRVLAATESVTEAQKSLHANERAALLWQCGRAAEALAVWEALPDSGPVLFNRGMAALFLKQPAKAATSLLAAVATLPESDGWHHLASLYLALAEMRV